MVLKKPIEATPNENFDLIECDKEIEPKEIIADELDNITFIGNYYEPPYRCYKKEDKFIIEVDICSKLKDKTLSIIHFSDKENNELEIFRIKGERLLVGEEKNEKKKIIYNFTNKRANAKLFELNFKINLSEKGVISISGNNESFINKGILYISFDIIN